MNVTLSQSEIKQAIKDYISSQGISVSGKQISITLTAGRKENGLSASVVISDFDQLMNVLIARTGCEVVKPVVVESFTEMQEAQEVPAETEESVSQKSLFGA